MLKTIFSLSLFFTLLLSATALRSNTTPVKDLFTLLSDELQHTLFQTNQGNIAFSRVHSSVSRLAVPQYLLVDFNTFNVTEILYDILDSCESKERLFRKLHYHNKTSSLVYYCGNNRSLLVLDENNYKVQKSISIELRNYSADATDVRFTDDGDSLVITHLYGVFNSKPQPSELTRVDLKTRKVTGHFVFERYLGVNETVFDFAVNGTSNYIITQQVDATKKEADVKVRIYSLFFDKEDYSLTPITNFTYAYYSTRQAVIVTQLFIVGDLIATNNYNHALFFKKNGELVESFDDINLDYHKIGSPLVYEPFFQKGTSANVLYLSIGILDPIIYRLTVTGEKITKEVLDYLDGFYLSIGKASQSDLLIKQDLSRRDGKISIVEAKTNRTLYSNPTHISKFMRTNNTYGILDSFILNIYNLQNNSHIAKHTIIQDYTIQPEYFYDTENSLLYYLRTPKDYKTCDLVVVDIKSGSNKTLWTVSEDQACLGKIIQANSSTYEFVINVKTPLKNFYIILSNKFGPTTFRPLLNLYTDYIVPQYDTLNSSLVAFNATAGSFVLVQLSFDNSTKAFTIRSSKKLENMYFLNFDYYYLGDNVVYVVAGNGLVAIDITDGSTELFSLKGDGLLVPSRITYRTLVVPRSAGTPYLLSGKTLTQLPGSTEKTISAAAAGSSSYYVIDSFQNGVFNSLHAFKLNQQQVQQIVV